MDLSPWNYWTPEGKPGENTRERKGDVKAAIAHLRNAAKLEDGLVYGEPPEWSVPVRQELGAMLLKAGRAAQAERTFKEDLRRFPQEHLVSCRAPAGAPGEARCSLIP